MEHNNTKMTFKHVEFEILWEDEGITEKGFDKKSGETLFEISSEFSRPVEVDILLGDASRAKERLSWQPKTTFEELVRIRVEADMQRMGSLKQ